MLSSQLSILHLLAETKHSPRLRWGLASKRTGAWRPRSRSAGARFKFQVLRPLVQVHAMTSGALRHLWRISSSRLCIGVNTRRFVETQSTIPLLSEPHDY